MADGRSSFSERVAESDSDLNLDADVFDAVVSAATNSLEDLVYFVDETGSLVTWNDALLELTGYTDAEVAECSPLDFFEGADRERMDETLDTVLTEGHGVTQADLVTRSGEQIPMEFSNTRLTDDEGIPIGLVGIGRRLTHSSRLEERYRSILDRMTDAFLALDADWRITYLNDRAREMLSLEERAVVGEDVLDLFPEAADGEAFHHVERAMEDQEPSTYERYSEPAGTWLEVRVYPDEDGVSIFFKDVADRVRRERSLERQNERLEAFASLVSHDLRNPLNVATGRLDLIEEDVDDAHFEAMDEALDRIETILDDMLELAREGTAIEDPAPFDMASVARAAWSTVKTPDGTLEVKPGLGTVHGDPSRLRRAFENLFRNAIEHDGSTVTVGPIPDGFYVADDGPGFEHDPQRALEHGHTTREDGTGLGLSIVTSVVEAHGWTLTATEGAEGGARFEVHF